jgi:hypothetical protein
LSFTRQGGVPTSLTVTLAAGQDLTENETLSPAASIFGYVAIAGTGQIVPGAQVDLYLSSQYPSVVTAATTTNDDGEFTFDNVQAPESFIVAVSYPAGTSPQETVLITTGLGVASPACGSHATGESSTTTTVATSGSTTSTSTTTTTLPGSTTTASSCNAPSDPLLVSTS